MFFGNEDKTMLFLERLIDNMNNELTIFVSKSVTIKPTAKENAAKAAGNENVFNLLENNLSVVPDFEHFYKIYFDEYIMYQTRNERFCLYDADEIRIGHGLIIFTKSKLLEVLNEFTPFISNGENETALYPGKWKHYGIYTAENVIDVISHKEPIIEKVNHENYNFG